MRQLFRRFRVFMNTVRRIYAARQALKRHHQPMAFVTTRTDKFVCYVWSVGLFGARLGTPTGVHYIWTWNLRSAEAHDIPYYRYNWA